MAIVLFDLDGTLINSAADIHAASNIVLAAEGFAPLDKATVQSFIGNGLPVLISRLLAAHGQDGSGPLHQRMLASFEAAYESAVDLTQPYPGVGHALDRLSASGHRLGVVTNKPRKPAEAVLNHLALRQRFDLVLGGDSLPQRKPDPAPLHHAVALLGGGPAIYVGDSEVDAETALRAKVPFLLYTEGYRKNPVSALPHAAAFHDFSDLPNLVERQLRQVR